MAPPLPSSRTTSTVVSEIEGYIKSKDIEQLFKKVLTRCFRVRPEDPIEFVFDYLVDTYPHIAAAKGLVTVSGGSGGDIDCIRVGMDVGEVNGNDGGGGGTSVVVTHPDLEVLTYLNQHLSVASLFETIADRLAEDRPEKPLQHVVNLLALAGDGDIDTARSGSDASTEFDESDDEDHQNEAVEMPSDGVNKNGNARAWSAEDSVAELRPCLMTRDPSSINRERRPSVSAECVSLNANGDVSRPRRGDGNGSDCYGGGGVPDAVATPLHPKTDAEKASIIAIVRDNILFKDLDQRLIIELVDAVFPTVLSATQVIIKQGDEVGCFRRTSSTSKQRPGSDGFRV